jgi:outer membrane protein OmpA-like peptidoglycan-associated protein
MVKRESNIVMAHESFRLAPTTNDNVLHLRTLRGTYNRKIGIECRESRMTSALSKMVAASASVTLIAGCSSGLNRSKEEQLNAQYGIAMQQVKGGVEMRLPETPLFDADESKVRSASVATLNRAADVLKRSMRPILIEGHTDNDGSLAYNQDLSEARAEAVAKALIARGVPAERITTKGMAFLRPIASNDTAQGRAMNRRVEILVRAESEDTLLGKPKKIKR